MKLKRIPFSAFTMALFAGCIPNLVEAQRYVTFDVPGATQTHPLSINNRGDVTGYFLVTPSGQQRGFVRESNENISIFDGIPTSINDAGTVAGSSWGAYSYSFLRDRAGNLTTFDVPPVYPPPPPAPLGYPTTINNQGDVAGWILACEMCDSLTGFVRNRQGNITTFFVERGLQPTSINARGDIAGNTSPYYIANSDGFVRNKDGVVTMFGLGAWALSCASINNRGDTTGYFYDRQLNRTRSFVRESQGNITLFDATPDAVDTRSVAINERGDVAGRFADATGDHRFLRTRMGKITVFDIPGVITSLNDSGDVAGYLWDGHGFIRTAQ